MITVIITSHIVVYVIVSISCIIPYMPEATTPHPPRYGPPSRGITSRDVELAADALLRAGERPTIEKIREKIGRGSPNTINPILDAWWKRLAARLDAGPAALHRLPESVAHVAEALWMQALDEGRRRAQQETARDARTAAEITSDLAVRSHVLTLREGELDSRLRDRERIQATLEAQLESLTLLLRKELAARDAQARRVSALEEQLSVRPRPSAGRTRKQPARHAGTLLSKKKSAPKRIDRIELRRRTSKPAAGNDRSKRRGF
jgi:hypothetical protein